MSAISSQRSLPLARPTSDRARWQPRSWSLPSLRKWLPLMLPGSVLLIAVLASLLAPWVAPYDPNALDMKAALSGPTADHWLGTDSLGRDQLSRILYGGRSTLLVSGIGVLGIVGIGLVVGTVAGYLGGIVDLLISALLSALLALPTLLLTLAILGVLGPGRDSLLIALIGAGWVGHARIFRASMLSLRERPYVEAARAIGASRFTIWRRHLLPQMLTTIVVLATLDIGALILTVSSLSFLGLGVQPPTADWGVMLNESRSFLSSLPILAIAPGVCISLVALASSMLGDGLRDLVDIGRKTR